LISPALTAIRSSRSASAAIVAPEMTLAVAEIAPAETVAHTGVVVFVVRMATVIVYEVATVIPRAASVVVPAVASAIGVEEVGTAEIEIVAVRIAGVDAEMPEACVPVERAIEIARREVGVVLPVEQYIA